MAKPEFEFFPVSDVDYTPCPGDVPELKERVLARDEESGTASRILRLEPGVDTSPNGVQVHDFWEEVYIIEGSFTDRTLGRTFTAACQRLQISVVKSAPRTPTDKPHIERLFSAVNTLFVQYLAGYTGRSVRPRRRRPARPRHVRASRLPRAPADHVAGRQPVRDQLRRPPVRLPRPARPPW